MDYLVWAAVMLVVAVVLVICELFVPSAGVLAFLAAASLVAAVVCAFLDSPSAGLLFVLLTVIGTPALLFVLFRWWPNTPIGRKMMLTLPDPDEVKPDSRRLRELQALIGHTGVAATKMLLSGAVNVDGKVYGAVSDGMAIDEGTPVRVIKVKGNVVVVRAIDDSEINNSAAASFNESRAATSPLDQPIDTLGIDPDEDPLA
ncbi:MAG: NfeD family protein [Planctomycetales bacterium]|nr:NfeD family protein [Planctomycetales bacterium]